jgi:hypothetical protein
MPPGQENVTISTNDVRVRDALQFIDTVLIANGLVRDPKPPAANSLGFIASYGPDNNPDLYVRGNRVVVLFSEYWNHHSRLSERTRKVCNSLRNELIIRYGAERVKKE